MASSAPTPQSRVSPIRSKSIDYKKRDTIADHIKSKKHIDLFTKKKQDVAGNALKRQKQLKLLLQHNLQLQRSAALSFQGARSTHSLGGPARTFGYFFKPFRAIL